MRTAARFSLALLLAWCASFSFHASARADTAVAALGVRSLDGEDDLERRLSTALRNSAGAIAGWSVGKREASLEQMTLAHGCEESDNACLGEICRTLAVDVLLYGTVVNTPAGYELTIYQYDTTNKRVRSADARGLRVQELRGPSARESVVALLTKLNVPEQTTPVAVTGQLHVYGNVPGAQIAVDGATRGSLDERGELTMELTPGQHVVRAAGEAFAPAEEKIAQIEAGETSEVVLQITPAQPVALPPPILMPQEQPAPPPPPETHTVRRAFGWISLGVGAAFAVATVYSWVRIERINDDHDFLTYRAAFPSASSGKDGVSNVCPLAADGELAKTEPERRSLEQRADSLCKEADKLQKLQYVFLAGTIAGAGLGTYLLVSARRLDRKERTSLSIAPSFGLQSASLEARLRF